MVVGIDEETLRAKGGMRNIRPILAEALDRLNGASPRAVALDVILADDVDPVEDARLEAALRATRNLILACQLAGGKWEDPAARFKPCARALWATFTRKETTLDGVSRQIESGTSAKADNAAGRSRWKRFAWRGARIL